MKATDKPTKHILLKAETNSEWDSCDFALIHLTEDWESVHRKRLEDLTQFSHDNTFSALTYYTWTIEFYVDDEKVCKSSNALLGEKKWTFISISEKQLRQLQVPENKLEGYKLFLYSDGTAFYKANGEYTGENFCTIVFPLYEIIEQLEQSKTNPK